MEIVTNTAGLDSLEKYLNFYPDVVATLSGTGDFTLFAPDNNAFINLLATPGFPQDIRSINPDIVKGVLAYHVSTTRFEAADLSAGTAVTSLQGEAIEVNTDGTLKTGSTNGAIQISEADIKATNGVVHVTATVLIPPSVGASLTPILGTNAGVLLLGAAFSDLAAAITVANAYATENSLPTLTSILAGSTAHTVFAPTNATFAAGQITAESFTGQQWYGIIANHVVMADVTADTLTSTTAQTTGVTFNSALLIDPANGTYNPLFFFYADAAKQNGIGVFIDSNREFLGGFDPTNAASYAIFNGEVALPNAAVTANGRVHVIAGVLAPQ